MEKPYSPENRDEMRDDLDRVINNNRPETINTNPMTPTHYQFADKEVIDMMAAIWGNEAAKTFLILSAFKYQMRAGIKTKDPTADIEKARHCLELANQFQVLAPEFDINPYEIKPGTIKEQISDPNSSGYKGTQPIHTTANHTAVDMGNECLSFNEDWNDIKQHPKRDEFVLVRFIGKLGFDCVKIGQFDPELDEFIDLDGYRINNPIKWKLINFANNAPSNSYVNPKQQDADKEDEWIYWRGFGDDPKPEPYLIVDLKITKCSDEITKCPDEDVRYGFGYWNPEINDWNTLLEFDKSKHSIQWRKIKY